MEMDAGMEQMQQALIESESIAELILIARNQVGYKILCAII